MLPNRAYSLLTIKTVDEARRRLVGIASTPTTDRVGDVVEPKGAKFTLPLPLLWQHNHAQPIGKVIRAKQTKDGIEVEAEIAQTDEPGNLKNRLDEAWQSIKLELVRGLSVGFRILDWEPIKETGGLRIMEWDWLELSAVTIPANQEATIQSIKSIDQAALAASGNTAHPVVQLGKPKASAMASTQKGSPMKTTAEQIAAFEAARVAKQARMEEIMNKASEEGRSLDEAEAEEYDGLKSEVDATDKHLARLRDLQKTQVAKATEPKGSSAETAAVSRSPIISMKHPELPKGTGFVRYAMALAASKGNLMQAAEYSKRWKDSTPEVETVLKAAVTAGTTTDADWALPLVEYRTLADEFIELLRPQTIIGRIPNLRRVPFNVRMPSQTQGGVYGWVGEGAPKPVGELKFGELTLRWAKAAGIIVLTEELVRMSNPSAEAIVRQDMTAGIAAFLDQQFVDPSVTEVANVSPASITNGAFTFAASGTDAAAVRADLRVLFNHYIAANQTPSSGVWIMSGTTALALSLMVNALGQPEFPGINMTGGTFAGLPVVVSEHVAGGTGGGLIILANARDILLADDGGVTLDVSREASLQMNDAPSAGAQSLVSLWQNNLIGLRAERFINWKRRRDEAVAYINDVNYGTA